MFCVVLRAEHGVLRRVHSDSDTVEDIPGHNLGEAFKSLSLSLSRSLSPSLSLSFSSVSVLCWEGDWVLWRHVLK